MAQFRKYGFGAQSMKADDIAEPPPRNEAIEQAYDHLAADEEKAGHMFLLTERFRHCAYSCVQANPHQEDTCVAACLMENLEFMMSQ